MKYVVYYEYILILKDWLMMAKWLHRTRLLTQMMSWISNYNRCFLCDIINHSCTNVNRDLVKVGTSIISCYIWPRYIETCLYFDCNFGSDSQQNDFIWRIVQPETNWVFAENLSSNLTLTAVTPVPFSASCGALLRASSADDHRTRLHVCLGTRGQNGGLLEHTHYHRWESRVLSQYKDRLSRYWDFHVKDKTVLSLTRWSLYW